MLCEIRMWGLRVESDCAVLSFTHEQWAPRCSERLCNCPPRSKHQNLPNLQTIECKMANTGPWEGRTWMGTGSGSAFFRLERWFAYSRILRGYSVPVNVKVYIPGSGKICVFYGRRYCKHLVRWPRGWESDEMVMTDVCCLLYPWVLAFNRLSLIALFKRVW